MMLFQYTLLLLGFDDNLTSLGLDLVVLLMGFLEFFTILLLILYNLQNLILSLRDIHKAIFFLFEFLELMM